jgi:hypothetical protein
MHLPHSPLAILSFNAAYAASNIYSTMDVIRKAMAANAVYLLSMASMVLPLFLPKKVSAPPAMDPDSPADFPDCSNTKTMIEIANKICKIFIIIFTALKKNTSKKSTSSILTQLT